MGESGQDLSIPSHTGLRRSRGIEEGTGYLLKRSLDRARTRGAVHIAHAQRRLGDATVMGFAFSLVNASSSSASWRASRAVGFCAFAVALILILPLLLISLGSIPRGLPREIFGLGIRYPAACDGVVHSPCMIELQHLRFVWQFILTHTGTGKMFHQMLRRRLNTADHASSVVPLFKGSFHLAANSFGTHLRRHELSTVVTDAFIANLP